MQVALATNLARFQPYIDRLAARIQGLIRLPDSSIVCCAINAGILLLKHQIGASGIVNDELLRSIARTINRSNNDVNLACTNGLAHLVGLNPADLKLIIPILVDGIKDKSGAVRASAEEALVHLLQLRQGNNIYQVYKAENIQRI